MCTHTIHSASTNQIFQYLEEGLRTPSEFTQDILLFDDDDDDDDDDEKHYLRFSLNYIYLAWLLRFRFYTDKYVIILHYSIKTH